jgi:hypothetical protein
LALTVTLLAGGGCRGSKSDYYLSKTYDERLPTPGSVGDLKRKQAGQKSLRKSATEAQNLVVLLVAHDAQGKPVAAEVQRSCGEPELDARARQFALYQRRFPPGKANTVTLTIDPRTLRDKSSGR